MDYPDNDKVDRHGRSCGGGLRIWCLCCDFDLVEQADVDSIPVWSGLPIFYAMCCLCKRFSRVGLDMDFSRSLGFILD